MNNESNRNFFEREGWKPGFHYPKGNNYEQDEKRAWKNHPGGIIKAEGFRLYKRTDNIFYEIFFI